MSSEVASSNPTADAPRAQRSSRAPASADTEGKMVPLVSVNNKNISRDADSSVDSATAAVTATTDIDGLRARVRTAEAQIEATVGRHAAERRELETMLAAARGALEQSEAARQELCLDLDRARAAHNRTTALHLRDLARLESLAEDCDRRSTQLAEAHRAGEEERARAVAEAEARSGEAAMLRVETAQRGEAAAALQARERQLCAALDESLRGQQRLEAVLATSQERHKLQDDAVARAQHGQTQANNAQTQATARADEAERLLGAERAGHLETRFALEITRLKATESEAGCQKLREALERADAARSAAETAAAESEQGRALAETRATHAEGELERVTQEFKEAHLAIMVELEERAGAETELKTRVDRLSKEVSELCAALTGARCQADDFEKAQTKTAAQLRAILIGLRDIAGLASEVVAEGQVSGCEGGGDNSGDLSSHDTMGSHDGIQRGGVTTTVGEAATLVSDSTRPVPAPTYVGWGLEELAREATVVLHVLEEQRRAARLVHENRGRDAEALSTLLAEVHVRLEAAQAATQAQQRRADMAEEERDSFKAQLTSLRVVQEEDANNHVARTTALAATAAELEEGLLRERQHSDAVNTVLHRIAHRLDTLLVDYPSPKPPAISRESVEAMAVLAAVDQVQTTATGGGAIATAREATITTAATAATAVAAAEAETATKKDDILKSAQPPQPPPLMPPAEQPLISRVLTLAEHAVAVVLHESAQARKAEDRAAKCAEAAASHRAALARACDEHAHAAHAWATEREQMAEEAATATRGAAQALEDAEAELAEQRALLRDEALECTRARAERTQAMQLAEERSASALAALSCLRAVCRIACRRMVGLALGKQLLAARLDVAERTAADAAVVRAAIEDAIRENSSSSNIGTCDGEKGGRREGQALVEQAVAEQASKQMLRRRWRVACIAVLAMHRIATLPAAAATAEEEASAAAVAVVTVNAGHSGHETAVALVPANEGKAMSEQQQLDTLVLAYLRDTVALSMSEDNLFRRAVSALGLEHPALRTARGWHVEPGSIMAALLPAQQQSYTRTDAHTRTDAPSPYPPRSQPTLGQLVQRAVTRLRALEGERAQLLSHAQGLKELYLERETALLRAQAEAVAATSEAGRAAREVQEHRVRTQQMVPLADYDALRQRAEALQTEAMRARALQDTVNTQAAMLRVQGARAEAAAADMKRALHEAAAAARRETGDQHATVATLLARLEGVNTSLRAAEQDKAALMDALRDADGALRRQDERTAEAVLRSSTEGGRQRQQTIGSGNGGGSSSNGIAGATDSYHQRYEYSPGRRLGASLLDALK